MARVTVEDCIDKVENRFDLVLLASHRARMISSGAQITVERPTPIAEIAMPESLLLPFIFDFERRELVVGETSSVFQPTEEMTAELAGAGSYVAEPE